MVCGSWLTKVDTVMCESCVCERWCVTKLCCVWQVKDGGWQRWLTKMVCEGWCVKDGWQRWCVKDGVWKMVCERWWLTKACVCVWQSCVVCDRRAAGGGGGGGRGPGYRIRNKNPTQSCGGKSCPRRPERPATWKLSKIQSPFVWALYCIHQSCPHSSPPPDYTSNISNYNSNNNPFKIV